MNLKTDLNDMLYFTEVVERGGFAAAGRALDIPKSRLSRRVAELEEQLDVRLLQRTTRKLALSEVGEQYLRHCLAMREAAQAVAQVAAQVQTEPRGTIRVSCPVTLAQSSVAVLLPLFMREFPEVRVEMLVTNRVIDLVEEGIDVALRVRPTPDWAPPAGVVPAVFPSRRGLVPAVRRFLDLLGEPLKGEQVVHEACTEENVCRVRKPVEQGVNA